MRIKRKKIMVVDDDVRHIETAREILEDEGYDVVTHQYGFGASSAIRANQPDLVLLDINMPALSGEKLTEILSANEYTKCVPVVFYSSNDEDSLRMSVARHRVRGYICKGSIAELRRKVVEFLREPSGAPVA